MPFDNKYGKVTLEHGSVGENEPVVVFRATDILVPDVLQHYYFECVKAGSPQKHLDLISDTYNMMISWQDRNPTRIPKSEGWTNKGRERTW